MNAKDCACLTNGPPPKRCKHEKLGETSYYAEISLLTCPDCGRRWLHYFFEHVGFSRATYAYTGLLGDAPIPEVEKALDVLNTLEPRLVWLWKEARWNTCIYKIKPGLFPSR